MADCADSEAQDLVNDAGRVWTINECDIITEEEVRMLKRQHKNCRKWGLDELANIRYSDVFREFDLLPECV